MIRHKLKVLAVANGQRVPEDWHRLSSAALVQQALRVAPASAWRIDAAEMNLVFAGLRAAPAAMAPGVHA
jgi:flagellar biosynthesis protein FlhF